MTTQELYAMILVVLGMYLGMQIYKYIIRPWLIEKNTTDIEKNPKWIIPKLREKYYGFQDIDIILVRSTFGHLPRLRWTKDNRLQVLISEDTSIRDTEDIARVALAAKIRIKYGMWFPEKPVHWLSILCYMLDGGDIKQEATKWENTK